MQLTPATFDQLRGAIQKACGLVISDDKEYLVRDRLAPLIADRKLESFENLGRRLQAGFDDQLLEAVVDAVTTRETSFFRDPHVFQSLLADVFPRLVAELTPPGRAIRIWSAGTANGQEAYSLAMLANEYLASNRRSDMPGLSFSICATDISRAALRVAEAGVYDAREMARGVDATRATRFFQREGKKFRAVPALRSLIEFRQVNLCNSLTAMGAFDLICCRNVLIYFDIPTRQRICRQFQNQLRENGWLLLGAAENLYGLQTEFESVRAGDSLFYRKSGRTSPDRRD